MRKFLAGTGLLIAVYLLSIPIRTHFLRTEAANFTNDSLAAVFSGRGIASLLERASDSLKASPREQLAQHIELSEQAFGRFSGVFDRPACDLFRGVSSFDRKERTYAKCFAKTVFEKRSTSVTVVLVNISGQWYINDLIFN